MGNYKPLFVWWVLTSLLAAVAYYLQTKGVFLKVWEADITHISSLIAFVTVIGVGRIGWMSWQWGHAKDLVSRSMHVPRLRKNVEDWWHVSEQFMAMGILGTVTGFAFLFYEVFGGLSTSSNIAAEIPKLIPQIISPMGTIFFCTAAGLAGTLIIRNLLRVFTSLTGIEDRQYVDQ